MLDPQHSACQARSWAELSARPLEGGLVHLEPGAVRAGWGGRGRGRPAAARPSGARPRCLEPRPALAAGRAAPEPRAPVHRPGAGLPALADRLGGATPARYAPPE